MVRKKETDQRRMARPKSTPAAAAADAATATSSPSPAPAPAPAKLVEQTPPSAPEVEDTTANTPPPAVPEDASDKLAGLIGALATLMTKIKDLGVELRDTISAAKVVQKDVMHLQKAAAKRSRRATGGEGSTDGGAARRPSGFAKPSLLSDELCKFLGMDNGSLIARTDVTRAITKYVKENNLFDAADKRTIVPDNKLSALLNTKPAADGSLPKITYFNLQSHIKQHFIKETPAVVATA